MRVRNVTIKDRPEDFQVREVAALPESCPAAEASHTYLSITKQGISTFDAARRVARALGRTDDAVRWLGLKDEDGVTTQVLSLTGVLGADDVDRLSRRLGEDQSPGWVSVDHLVAYGRCHVPRHLLIGNVFGVTLRGVEPAQLDRLAALGDGGYRLVFPNYYDSQRFGVIGSGVANTHVIGQCLLDGDLAGAYEAFLRSGNPDERKRELVAGFERFGDYRRAFALLEPRLVQFLLDAAASFRWNVALSDALGRSGPVSTIPGLNGVQDLNLCPLDDRPIPPVVTVESAELKAEPKADAIQPDSVQDPVQEVLPLQPTSFRRLSTQSVKLHAVAPVEAGTRGDVARLEFFLPTGAYATMFLKYLIHQLSAGPGP